jgi:hypothetical protein
MYKAFITLTCSILATYLMFTTGIVFEVKQIDNIEYPALPYSVALSDDRLNLSGHITEVDRQSRAWLEKQSFEVIYADFYGILFLQETMYLRNIKALTSGDLSLVPQGGYIWLSQWSKDNQSIVLWTGQGSRKVVKITGGY